MGDELRGWRRAISPTGGPATVTPGAAAYGPKPGGIEWAIYDGAIDKAKWLVIVRYARERAGNPQSNQQERIALYQAIRTSPQFDPRWLTAEENGIVASLWAQSRPPSGFAGAVASSGAASFLRSLPPASIGALAAIPGAGPPMLALIQAAGSGATSALASIPATSALGQQLSSQWAISQNGALITAPFGKAGSLAIDNSPQNVKAVAISQGAEIAGAVAGVAGGALAGTAGLATGSAGAEIGRAGITATTQAGYGLIVRAANGQDIDVQATVENIAASVAGAVSGGLAQAAGASEILAGRIKASVNLAVSGLRERGIIK